MTAKRTALIAAVSITALFFSAQLRAEESVVAPGTRISVTDFGAVPNDGRNDVAALRDALAFARKHPGITLQLPPGVYNVRDEAAVALMDRAMAGELGPNPEPTIFKPYYPYARGLDFRGVSGLTIEAHGAVLLCEGWMEPVSIDQAKDITIKGLTIDYKRRAYSAGDVVAVGDGHVDAIIEDQYPINPKMPVPRAMFWDPAAHRIITEGDAKIEIRSAQTIRLYTRSANLPHMLGSKVGLMHSMHFRPAILIQHSDTIRLESVTIHSQPGMGIVGHRSSNIAMIGLRIVPAPGSVFSTTTDATHFTSCTGFIRIENSQFEGFGDDGTNIHNYYYSVAKARQRGRYDLTLPILTHAGVLDYPDVGDSLELVDASSLAPVRSLTVTSVAIFPQELRTEVTFDTELPQDLQRYYLVNITRLPKVEIVGSNFMSHRARGVLIKTGNVLIERNLFFENTGTAIHVAAEGGWREGVPSHNVVIRGNRIIGGGYGGGTISQASAIAVNIDAKEQPAAPLHRGLLIEGNIIDGAGAEKCISISQAQDVEIRYNEFSGCRTPISSDHSQVNIHDNTTVVLPAAQSKQRQR